LEYGQNSRGERREGGREIERAQEPRRVGVIKASDLGIRAKSE